MSDQLHSDRKSYLNFTEEEDDEDEDVYKDFQTTFSFKSKWKCAHCGSTNVTSINTSDNFAKFQIDCTIPGTSQGHLQSSRSMPQLLDTTDGKSSEVLVTRCESNDSILAKQDKSNDVNLRSRPELSNKTCTENHLNNIFLNNNNNVNENGNILSSNSAPGRSMEFLNQGWDGDYSLGVEEVPPPKSGKKGVKFNKDDTQKGTKKKQTWYRSWRNTFRLRSHKISRPPLPDEMRSDKQDLKLKLIEMGYDEQLATVAANKYKNMDQAIAYIKSINGLSRIRQIKEADKRQKIHQLVSARAVPTLEKAILVVQIMELGYDENTAIIAAKDCDTINDALSHLSFECQMCYKQHPASQMVSMYCCTHSCCINCVKNYFLKIIYEQPILKAICPVCKKPNCQDADLDLEYFNHLGNLLKRLIHKEDYEQFQNKLRTTALENNPYFKWCQKCDYGYYSEPGSNNFKCPNCGYWMCLRCGKEWKFQHEGVSCEIYAAWLAKNDLTNQAGHSYGQLDSYGISCPSCQFQFESVRRSCLYFICSQCRFEFCTGCGASFVEGDGCQSSEKCSFKGLHAHHTRSCHFYLRDRVPFDLQNLLLLHRVKFVWDTPLISGCKMKGGRCPIIEQHSDGRKDEICGRQVKAKQAGLCQKHYIEYLISLIHKHGVDPADIFGIDELRTELSNHNKIVPMRKSDELKENYRRRLLEIVKCDIPLAGAVYKRQLSNSVLI